MDRKLQRHRADSLRQHGFLVRNLFSLLACQLKIIRVVLQQQHNNKAN